MLHFRIAPFVYSFRVAKASLPGEIVDGRGPKTPTYGGAHLATPISFNGRAAYFNGLALNPSPQGVQLSHVSKSRTHTHMSH